MTILFVVESPGKIKKISAFLGKGYVVKASVGHFRDLDKKSMSIDFEKNFKPIYVITRADVVKNLKSAMRGVDMLYIASDLDFEGEAIAQHIYDVLKPKKYKRLIFNAITKAAIMDAIKNAGQINQNLVDAQKARRILDRLCGYMISPILQKQIGGKLSAGRVQSVAAKIVIDKEREIRDFLEKNDDATYFRVSGLFSDLKSNLYGVNADLVEPEKAHPGKSCHIEKDKNDTCIKNFLKLCLKSKFTVRSVSSKMTKRSPAPPFETSTLQQEASRKFGMSVDSTMKTAQKLYEQGYITYMRTDSVEISKEAHQEIRDTVIQLYGKEYYQKTFYKNKSANSQEAHEAIRPTHCDKESIADEVDDSFQIKLYRLIWQRTIASQMKPAEIKVTSVQIDGSKLLESQEETVYYFQSQIEKVIFQGFMKVYVESKDDTQDEEEDVTQDFKGKIPKMGHKVVMQEVNAKQEYRKPPPRYSEASLVKTLKKLGIGRPSTYVNTIKTIVDREYVKKGDVPGIKKQVKNYVVKSKTGIQTTKTTVLIGRDIKKIIPTDLGMTVNEFLEKNFPEIMDYKFTAKMEADLDAIAKGEKVWHRVVKKFYDNINPIIQKLSLTSGIKSGGPNPDDRYLGKDKDGNKIYASKTKFGPVVKRKQAEKFVYAKIPADSGLTAKKIDLQDAIKLLRYPKNLGEYHGNDIMLHKGVHGYYFAHGGKNYSIKNHNDSSFDVNKCKLADAIKIIKTIQTQIKSNVVSEFKIKCGKKTVDASILKGMYGFYIKTSSDGKHQNYYIPKYIKEPTKLTGKQVQEIVVSQMQDSKKNKTGSSKASSGSKSNKKSKAGSKKTTKKKA